MRAGRNEVFFIESSAVQTAKTYARTAGSPHYVRPVTHHGRGAFAVSATHPARPPYTKVHPDGRAVIHTASRLDPSRRRTGRRRTDPASSIAKTAAATRALRPRVEAQFLPLFDHLLSLAEDSARHGDPQGAGRELREARKLAGEHKAMRPAAKSRRVGREWLGFAMQHWHSSGGDPIYAVGSYYGSGKPYPVTGFAGPHRDGPSVVRAALASIESYIPKAEAHEHGWTKRDAGQLRTIAAGLRYYLKHDYKAAATDPRRRVAWRRR